jgi:hypothetical protein
MNESLNPTRPHAERDLDVGAARADVVSALGRLERSERNGLEEVRGALCRFIASLRAGGASYESVVDIVRDLVATPATPDGASTLHPSAREALVELSIHWCAAEYRRGT